MVPSASATEGHPSQTTRSSRIDATPEYRGRENCGVQQPRRPPIKRRKQKHDLECSAGLQGRPARVRRTPVGAELQTGGVRVARQDTERHTEQRTSTMTDYYAAEDAGERNSSVKSLFKAQRKQTVRRRQREEATAESGRRGGALQDTDQTFGFTTQNVNGLGATAKERDNWLSAFGTQDDHGRSDLMLIQQSHVEAAEVEWYRKKYANRCGFRSGPGQQELPYWAPSTGNNGGVAILIDPYGSFRAATPFLEHRWSPHFMAIRGSIDDKVTTVCNIYAPHKPADRERFYESLQDVTFETSDMLLVGGDFNSTLDAIADRSHARTAHNHDSPDLRTLLSRWGLLDPVAVARPAKWTTASLHQHHRETHTYTYPLSDSREATSRLDRWYVSPGTIQCVAAWNTVNLGPHADHKGVKLHIRSPDDPIRVRRPSRIYPVPDFAASAVKAVTTQVLMEFWEKLNNTERGAKRTQLCWDEIKSEIARRTRICIRERRRTRRNTRKQKLVRLLSQQQRLLAERDGQAPSFETITEELDGLSLEDVDGPTKAAQLRRAIAECRSAKASAGRRRLFREATYRAGKTTKALFDRISNKFGDNVLHRLDPIQGAPVRSVHDKADTLADAWQPILQQATTDPSCTQKVVEWNGPAATPSPAQSAIADDFTEEEVRKALTACKPGKAAGPDGLENSWYREHEDMLVPILTRLFNEWYEAGGFPTTFLEAEIFCLKKGGAQSDALNYRPLALLNTDYKILTRLLATRVGITLPDQIHPNQNGFVPGRTIHETLDLYEAAQRMVLADPTQTEATALLLDFKKAYDSLDRGYILAVLRRKGYPEKIVNAVAALHAGTTARFLANGSKSRAVAVTSGIRQGCPLAPLHFILALDLLYRKLDGFLGAKGVILQSEVGQIELRVAGYADDTAAFVQDPVDIPGLMRTLSQFGRASGLQINTGETMVIALHPGGAQEGMLLPPTLTYRDATDACRYLGIQVGSNIADSTSWDLAADQLKIRLVLASRKVLTVDQRSVVAGAIIVSKLLYIARHAWSQAAEVAEMDRGIRNYVWHGNFTDEVDAARAWLDPDLAKLPRTEGGLAIPDLRAELYAMAATVVGRWAKLGTKAMHIVGDILFDDKTRGLAAAVYVTPEHVPITSTGIARRATLWMTGLQLIAQAGLQPSTTMLEDQAIVIANFALRPPTYNWNGEELDLMCSGKDSACYIAATALPKAPTGIFHPEWPPYVNIGVHRIFDKHGSLTALTSASGFHAPTVTYLRDIITWTRRGTGRLTLKFHAVIKTVQARATAENFALILMMNHAHIILRPPYPSEISIEAEPSDHPVVAALRNGAYPVLQLHASVTSSVAGLHIRLTSP